MRAGAHVTRNPLHLLSGHRRRARHPAPAQASGASRGCCASAPDWAGLGITISDADVALTLPRASSGRAAIPHLP
jgi:hypothetical protein